MQNIIYYPNPVYPDRLASIITDAPIGELIKQGIIPKDAKYYIRPYVTSVDDEEYVLNTTHSEFLKFNNPKKPTGVVPDVVYMREFYVERIRELRKDLFTKLDELQIRSLGKGKSNVVAEIEADKQALRDLPAKVKGQPKNIKSIKDFHSTLPAELLEDYDLKYINKI